MASSIKRLSREGPPGAAPLLREQRADALAPQIGEAMAVHDTPAPETRV